MRRRTTILLAFVWCACAAFAALTQAAAGTRPEQAPVVMIVFDEFPSISLLDRTDHIDAARYPNFTALARSSSWFPNATASVDETGRAMESLLTGSTPPRKITPRTANFPRNLFTLLGDGGFARDVSEEVTDLCPARLCPGAHEKSRSEILHELAGHRVERFRRWLRRLRPTRRPTLYFKHVLLPHVPLRYLPSGRHYASGPSEVIPGVTRAFHNRWLVNQIYQRHLLQLGLTDRLLGEAMRRLRQTGLWDRSLVIVTADNGESFGRFGDRHVITPRKTAEIALTPLFIKRPFQRTGATIPRHVRTIDVVPTVEDVLRLHRPWRLEGRSVFGPPADRIPTSLTLHERNGGVVHVSFRQLRRRADRLLRRKVRLFGTGPNPDALYWIGPDPLLLGQPLPLWPLEPRGSLRARFNAPAQFRAVRLSSGFAPTLVTGRIAGGGSRGRRDLALAVNGWIAATAPSFHLYRGGSELFSLMVPESVFHDGANRLQLFEVLHRRQGIRLRDLGAAA